MKEIKLLCDDIVDRLYRGKHYVETKVSSTE